MESNRRTLETLNMWFFFSLSVSRPGIHDSFNGKNDGQLVNQCQPSDFGVPSFWINPNSHGKLIQNPLSMQEAPAQHSALRRCTPGSRPDRGNANLRGQIASWREATTQFMENLQHNIHPQKPISKMWNSESTQGFVGGNSSGTQAASASCLVSLISIPPCNYSGAKCFPAAQHLQLSLILGYCCLHSS